MDEDGLLSSGMKKDGFGSLVGGEEGPGDG